MSISTNSSELSKLVPCKKCLLADLSDPTAISEAVQKQIEQIPDAKRTSPSEYAARLNQCRCCTSLCESMCRKCGCYVELRAAFALNHCPHELHLW